MKQLIILSGGQDSTTCLAQAVANYGAAACACITFSYGQRHAQEVEVARAVAAHFAIQEHLVMDLSWYSHITHSALLQPDSAILQPDATLPPNTQVDGRNMLFLLLAAIHAKRLGIREIVIGVSQTDFSGYPDCREVFIKSCNETLNLAMDFNFHLHAPLMHLTKAAVWRLADQLGVLEYIATNTLTCYNGIIGRGCGTCPACLLRGRGYQEYLKERSAHAKRL